MTKNTEQSRDCRVIRNRNTCLHSRGGSAHDWGDHLARVDFSPAHLMPVQIHDGIDWEGFSVCQENLPALHHLLDFPRDVADADVRAAGMDADIRCFSDLK